MFRSLTAVALTFIALSAQGFDRDFDSVPSDHASALDRRLTRLEEAIILQHDAARERESAMDEVLGRIKTIEVSILASAKAPLKAPDLKKAVEAKPARMGYYPTDGVSWTHPGSIRGHLVASHAAAKFDPAWFDSLTENQLLNLHDDLHFSAKGNAAAKARLAQYAVYARTSAVQPVATKSKTVTVTKSSSSSFCPTGGCPSSRSWRR